VGFLGLGIALLIRLVVVVGCYSQILDDGPSVDQKDIGKWRSGEIVESPRDFEPRLHMRCISQRGPIDIP